MVRLWHQVISSFISRHKLNISMIPSILYNLLKHWIDFNMASTMDLAWIQLHYEPFLKLNPNPRPALGLFLCTT